MGTATPAGLMVPMLINVLVYPLLGLWAAIWLARTLKELREGQQSARVVQHDLEARLAAVEAELKRRGVT